jgi:hypothetical protein
VDTTVHIVSDQQLFKLKSSPWKYEMQIYHGPYAEYKFIYLCMYIESRDRSVSIATGYGLGDRDSSPGRVKDFLFSTSSKPVMGPTQPPIKWVPGALSLGVKRPGREANHSPPISAEVKKT